MWCLPMKILLVLFLEVSSKLLDYHNILSLRIFDKLQFEIVKLYKVFLFYSSGSINLVFSNN